MSGLLGGLYFLGTAGRAYQKLFWHDEIVMLTLARLPLSDLWQALLDGTDLNPPLSHLLISSWHAIVGEGAILSRVPSMVGVVLAAVSAGILVGRRLGALAGLAAILIFLGTDAYRYAYEARPYGLMLGFSGAALVCWQSAASHEPRALWLTGLLGSLAAAVSCHYYATLLLAPLALAEVVRAVETRRPDWTLWSVMTVSLFPLVLFWPLITAIRSFSSGFFSPPSEDLLLLTYESAFIDLIVPFILTLVLVGPVLATARWPGRNGVSEAQRVPAHEWVLATGLLAVPIVGYGVAVVITGAFVPRYFLVSTLGISILVPYVIACVQAYQHYVFLSVAGVLLMFLVARDVQSSRLLLSEEPRLIVVYPSVLNREDTLPVVVTNGHVFVAIVHYAPRALVGRTVYLVSGKSPKGAELSYLLGLSRWNSMMQLEELDAFFQRNRRFLVYGPTPNRVLSEVVRRRGRAILRAVDTDRSLFAVSRPGACSLFEVSLD